MNFDIDCLRTFHLVAETMSFSRAGERVHRSQSTVSQQIGRLEEQIGKTLFLRRKGRVHDLTVDGNRLLQYARKILQLNDEAYSSMSDDILKGFVRLGVPLDFFGRDFTTWLSEFKGHHPFVGFEVEANQSENLRKRAMQAEFDLAFFKQEAGAGHGTTVLSEQMVWVGGGNVAPTRDRSVPLVLFPEGCAYRKFAISVLQAANIPWHISFVSPSFECLRTAVMEGFGVTVLARALVAPPLKVVGHLADLPALPVVEIAHAYGHQMRPRVVSELARFLSDRLATAGAPSVASAA